MKLTIQINFFCQFSFNTNKLELSGDMLQFALNMRHKNAEFKFTMS